MGRERINVASEDTKLASSVFEVNSKGYADAIAISWSLGNY